MQKAIKPILITVASVLGALLLAVLVYLLYVIFSYSRLPDGLDLTVEGQPSYETISVGETYTIVSQNLGFGAYTPDFTFFMDGGTESRARSEESARSCIDAGAEKVKEMNSDFIFFQEVDLDSTRSYHIDQYAMLRQHFPEYASVMAVNYDSAYLFYPFTEPHGASKSSMVTFSRFTITSSLRRSFPISTSFSKFLDLDRCYSVSRVPVSNGKELVLFNVHASAYGSDDSIRTAQMTMLLNDMKAEYELGNYVICGGDFNHDFTGNATQMLNGGDEVDFGWAQPFPADLIPDGFSRATSYAGDLTPTCRNCDIPYEKGNFTTIVDGFILSNNVKCELVENVSTDFTYSDHNPVKLVFILQ